MPAKWRRPAQRKVFHAGAGGGAIGASEDIAAAGNRVFRKTSIQKTSIRDLSPAGRGTHLDLRVLSQYLVVCETLNMGAAGRRMGMTTPAVSQLVHRLERDLGVTLFERAAHGLRVTPAGITLRERARELIVSESDALLELRSYRGELVPTLRLYMMDSIAVHLMNTIVPELTPLVRRLEVLSGRSLTHASDFLGGEIDILITGDAFADVPRLERHRLCRQDLVAVLPASVPPQQRSLAALADALPLIRFRENSSIDQDVEAYLKQQQIEVPRTIECGSAATILEVVAGGHGWTMAPPLVLSWFRHLWDRQAWIALPPPAATQPLYLIAHAETLLDIPALLAGRCRAALAREMQAWVDTPAAPALRAVRVDPD